MRGQNRRWKASSSVKKGHHHFETQFEESRTSYILAWYNLSYNLRQHQYENPCLNILPDPWLPFSRLIMSVYRCLYWFSHFPDVLSLGPRELIQRVAKGYHDACEINALFKLLNWTRLQFLLWSFRFTFLLSAKGRFYFTKAETKIP